MFKIKNILNSNLVYLKKMKFLLAFNNFHD